MRVRRSVRELIQRAAWRGVSLPVRAIVVQPLVARRAGGYGASVAVLDRDGRRTGEMLPEVPLAPIWLGADGRGIYCPPAQGQILIISWVDGDRAQPFISGADVAASQPPAEAALGALVLTDGAGTVLRIKGGKIGIETSQQSLLAAVEQIVDAVPKLIDSLIDSHGDSIISSTWPAEQLKATLQQVLDG